MSGKGASIPIVADASGVIKGTRDASGALDKVIDSLDDLSDAGADTSREIDRSLGKVEDAGTDASKVIERKFRDSFDEVKKDSGRASDSVKGDFKKAEQGVDDLKNNGASNAKEFAASWDGSAQGALDSIQGFTAEALEGFGPLGMAGGVALAAAGGALYTSITENAAAAEQRISDMFDDMLESQTGYLSQSYVLDELAKIVKSADDARISWAEAGEVARTTGLTQSQVAQAYAGDVAAGTKLTEALNVELERHNQHLADAKTSNEVWGEALVEGGAKVDAMADKWAATQTEVERAADLVGAFNAAQNEMANNAPRQVGSTLEEYENLRRNLERGVSIPVVADLDEAKRQIKALTDGTYSVTVNGRVVGMRYE